MEEDRNILRLSDALFFFVDDEGVDVERREEKSVLALLALSCPCSKSSKLSFPFIWIVGGVVQACVFEEEPGARWQLWKKVQECFYDLWSIDRCRSNTNAHLHVLILAWIRETSLSSQLSFLGRSWSCSRMCVTHSAENSWSGEKKARKRCILNIRKCVHAIQYEKYDYVLVLVVRKDRGSCWLVVSRQLNEHNPVSTSKCQFFVNGAYAMLTKSECMNKPIIFVLTSEPPIVPQGIFSLLYHLRWDEWRGEQCLFVGGREQEECNHKK